jgi:Ser-tRNA(Ala) deacylase AlaX
MQVRMYLDDTYRDQAETQVVATGQRDGVPWAAVERCLFHPQGGGQPADRGWINDLEIVPVLDEDSGLVVALAADGVTLPAFPAGLTVRTRIDLTARMTNAALHTAGHLIEAAGRAQGWQLAGNNHFPGQARIEFTASQPDVRLTTPEGREEATARLREAVAKAIADDLPVTAEIDHQGQRVVHLGALHAAPCGGTHVRSLGRLADVTLLGVKMRKGRIRVSYTASHGPS